MSHVWLQLLEAKLRILVHGTDEQEYLVFESGFLPQPFEESSGTNLVKQKLESFHSAWAEERRKEIGEDLFDAAEELLDLLKLDFVFRNRFWFTKSIVEIVD